MKEINKLIKKYKKRRNKAYKIYISGMDKDMNLINESNYRSGLALTSEDNKIITDLKKLKKCLKESISE
jgi:hypothetical protein